MKSRVIEKSMVLMLLTVLFINTALATDVGYILKNTNKVNQQVLDVFSELNLSVELIKDKNVLTTDLTKYRMLFVGDDRMRNTGKKVKLYNYPSVIMNKYYGKEWGLTDDDGISQLAANSPLSVRLISDGVRQVYTDYRDKSGGYLNYYFLDDQNKANFSSIARTYTGNHYDFGDAVAFAPKGVKLMNGKTSGGKLCFYGLEKTEFWTQNAKDLFIECIGKVLITCEKDSDCDDTNDYTYDTCINPGTIYSECRHEPIACLEETECGIDSYIEEPYCTDHSVLRNYINFTCNNQGTPESFCSNETHSILNETCSFECLNGSCIRCSENSDCGTDGFTGGNFCSGDDVFRNYTAYTCEAPGTPSSSCSNSTLPQQIQNCSDTCLAGSCVEITCYNDADCGIDSYIGESYCNVGDLYRDFRDFTCLNPGTPLSLCMNSTLPQLVEDCAFGCIGDSCLEGVHDVALINFSNSIGGVRLEYTNGTDILEDPAQLFCDRKYQISVTAKNLGNFYENVSFSGQVSSLFFSHNPISDFAPGDSSLKTKTLNFTLNQGNYNLIVQALISSDSNPFNNLAQRQVEIICPECFSDSECGTDGYIGSEYCLGKDVYQDYVDYSCLSPGTSSASCSADAFPNLKETCSIACYGGDCVSCIPGETRQCGTNAGECEYGIETCSSGTWGSCVGGINPSSELCDGKDNDCDSSTDENFPNLGNSCSVGVGICERTGVYVCSLDKLSSTCNAIPGTPQTEICDGLDNNCDGNVDEGCLCTNGQKRECGTGKCIGNQTCVSGAWGVCSTSGRDAGVCGKCDSSGNSVYDSTQDSDCNDGQFCTIDSCSGLNSCAFSSRDCSAFNLASIKTCNNNPDNNPLTLDFFPGFTSACSESQDRCITGTISLTYTCNKTCGAGCEKNSDCIKTECDNLDGCYSGIYRNYNDMINNCLSCSCESKSCTSYTAEADTDGDGYSASCGDCNNNDATIKPGASETCDGKDNDCDSLVDEGGVCVYQCSDAKDNDGDGFTDYPADPGCLSRTDNDESPFNVPQCSDAKDNDGDGKIDYPADPGCTNRADNSE